MIRKSWLLSHVNLCKKTISACVAQKLLIKGVIVFIRLGLRIFIQNDRKYTFTRKKLWHYIIQETQGFQDGSFLEAITRPFLNHLLSIFNNVKLCAHEPTLIIDYHESINHFFNDQKPLQEKFFKCQFNNWNMVYIVWIKLYRYPYGCL
jgi:hypothetical protein